MATRKAKPRGTRNRKRETVHPTAVVHPSAKLHPTCKIGPYCVIGAGVELGEGTELIAHVVVHGPTKVGKHCRFFPYAAIGIEPQDLTYHGEPTRLEIGERNTIREYCSLNRGTVQDAGVTPIGDDNWIMAYAHVAHDCRVGSNTVFANHATLGGHVHIGDWTVLGGFVGVHQFVKIGAHVMAGVASVILQDVPPYVTVAGQPCAPHGINSEGLRRRGFTPEAIAAIKRAYRTLYRSGLGLAEARADLEAQAREAPEVRPLVDFLKAAERGILR